MHDRPPTVADAATRRAREHRVGRGLPSYRPVRTPFVSMGPSLVDQRRRRRAYQRGLLAAGGLVAIIVGLVLLIVVLSREVVSRPVQAVPSANVAFPTGRPRPLALARVVDEKPNAPSLKLQLPISLKAITAIGYDAMKDPQVLELTPEGRRSNVSFATRLLRPFLATQQPSLLRYFSLSDGGKPKVVHVGAAPGTEVYAPVSGTVIAIADNVIDDEQQGVVMQIQPLGDAETIVVLRNMDLGDGVAVGQTVSEGTTLVGHVRPMGGSRQQPLSRYTHDDGDNLEMYVRRVQPDVPL